MPKYHIRVGPVDNEIRWKIIEDGQHFGWATAILIQVPCWSERIEDPGEDWHGRKIRDNISCVGHARWHDQTVIISRDQT